MARLIPTAAQLAAFDRAATDEGSRRERGAYLPHDPSVERGLNPWDERDAGPRRRPTGRRPTGRPPGRPRVAGSLRDLVAGLGAVGDWFETAAHAARVNAYPTAAALGVRVSCVQVAGGYRVTRISDDAPRGRWPAKSATEEAET